MNERLGVSKKLPLAERVAGINRFIDFTGRKTAEQLYWLTLTRAFDPEQSQIWDKKLDEEIDNNVRTLAKVCHEMRLSGERLFVPHPVTLCPVTFTHIKFSRDLISYEVIINAPTPDVIPLESALFTG